MSIKDVFDKLKQAAPANTDAAAPGKHAPPPAIERDGQAPAIGASILVRLIREAFARGGESEAIASGRQCFQESDDGRWDSKILAIARCEATLRGRVPRITYHEQKCTDCGGTGAAGVPGPTAPRCLTCRGDGFAPPNRATAP